MHQVFKYLSLTVCLQQLSLLFGLARKIRGCQSIQFLWQPCLDCWERYLF